MMLPDVRVFYKEKRRVLNITLHVHTSVTLCDLWIFGPETAAEGFAENAPNMDRMLRRMSFSEDGNPV